MIQVVFWNPCRQLIVRDLKPKFFMTLKWKKLLYIFFLAKTEL